MIEPRYRVSWFAVATSSFMEIINPVFTEVARGIRSSLDTLLDGKGFYHQCRPLFAFIFVNFLVIYSLITLIVFIFSFMWITGFKFKLSSLLFGIEFGPEPKENQKSKPKEDEKKLLMIENALQKMEALQLEMSKTLHNSKQRAKFAAKFSLPAPKPGPSGDHLPVENISQRENDDSDGDFECVN